MNREDRAEGWESLCVWKERAPGRVASRALGPPSGQNWQPEGPEGVSSPPFLPQKSHRRVGKSMDCRARGPPLQFLPYHLLSYDLGRSPTSVSLPCLIPNMEQCSCNAQVPATPSQFFLTQLYRARPSSLICANGEVLSPVFHHSSQRIFSF